MFGSRTPRTSQFATLRRRRAKSSAPSPPWITAGGSWSSSRTSASRTGGPTAYAGRPAAGPPGSWICPRTWRRPPSRGCGHPWRCRWPPYASAWPSRGPGRTSAGCGRRGCSCWSPFGRRRRTAACMRWGRSGWRSCVSPLGWRRPGARRAGSPGRPSRRRSCYCSGKLCSSWRGPSLCWPPGISSMSPPTSAVRATVSPGPPRWGPPSRVSSSRQRTQCPRMVGGMLSRTDELGWRSSGRPTLPTRMRSYSW
mmetsp:Transcript_91472/g.244938  ORF Transcript_91472/g.244938 Transcript_91472/m.244938 type:complete len:253 (-) Transcript_91472:1477-2235(-)